MENDQSDYSPVIRDIITYFETAPYNILKAALIVLPGCHSTAVSYYNYINP